MVRWFFFICAYIKVFPSGCGIKINKSLFQRNLSCFVLFFRVVFFWVISQIVHGKNTQESWVSWYRLTLCFVVFFYYGKYARKYEVIRVFFCFVSFCKTLWHSLIYILSFKTDSVGRYFIFVTSLFRTFNSRHKDFVQPIFEIEHT